MLIIKKIIWAKKVKTFEARKTVFKAAKNHFVNWSVGKKSYMRLYPGSILSKYNETLDKAIRLCDKGEDAFKNGEFKQALKCIDEAIVSLDNQIDILNISIAILKKIS